MNRFFFILVVLITTACTTEVDSNSAGQKPKEFRLISLNDAERAELDRSFGQLLKAQSEGDYKTALGVYLPDLFESEEQFVATVEAMSNYRESGVVQTFNEFELIWASPFVESFNRQIALVSFEVDHQVKLEGVFVDKFKAFEVNVRDQYGRNYYTPDPENNRYLIRGPVKFFAFKNDDGSISLLNEEFLRSPRSGEFIESLALHEIKKFENEAREKLGI